MTHYRKPMDWTEAKFQQAQSELHKWSYWLQNFSDTDLSPSIELIEALADDLNTPEALTTLRNLFRDHNYEQLAADLKFLGIWEGQSPSQITLTHLHDIDEPRSVSDRIGALLRRLEMHRNEKDYANADRIKNGLTAAGVVVNIGKSDTTYQLTSSFELSKLDEIE